jgi:hypothetical protein
VSISVLAFLLVAGVVLARDMWLHRNVVTIIAEATPNLVAWGLSQGQAESISWLVSRVSSEFRSEITLLSLLLGIAFVVIVHLERELGKLQVALSAKNDRG